MRAKIRSQHHTEKKVDKAQEDNRPMYTVFFENGKPPRGVVDTTYKHYMKDHVSKDLEVSIHQITPAHLRDREGKGFVKVMADLRWREPNDVEKKRDLKMLTGASLRKDLGLDLGVNL
jgi:hypothetical protein